jgi:hypothetical protein
MARAGDELENPATGDRLVFLRTASETGGEVLEYELEFVPRRFAVRDHLPPLQEERHEVPEGTLGIVVAGWHRRLGRDIEDVPVATRHQSRNPGSADPSARLRCDLPSSQVLLETLFGLARDGRVDAKGNPPPLQLAVIFSSSPSSAARRTARGSAARALRAVAALGRAPRLPLPATRSTARTRAK